MKQGPAPSGRGRDCSRSSTSFDDTADDFNQIAFGDSSPRGTPDPDEPEPPDNHDRDIADRSLLGRLRSRSASGLMLLGLSAGFAPHVPDLIEDPYGALGLPPAAEWGLSGGVVFGEPVIPRTTLDNVAETEQLILESLSPWSGLQRRLEAERELAVMDPGSEQLLDIAREALAGLSSEAPRWHREAYATFVATRELGIEYPGRIPSRLLPEIIENRQNLEPDGRPLAILIYCKGDWNGAFYGNHNTFAELIDNDYRVLYFEAESDTDFANALRAGAGVDGGVDQAADILMISGHGSRTRIWLERDEAPLPRGRGYIDFGDESWFRRMGVSAALSSGGQVILDSCSNGEGAANMDNVANFMRRIFPQAKPRGIWSAQESYGWIELVFNRRGALIDVDFPVPDYRARR